MPLAEISSLVTRRNELYARVPNIGNILELGVPGQAEESAWWSPPRGVRSTTFRLVTTQEEGEQIGKEPSAYYDSIIFYPGIWEPLRMLEIVQPLLRSRGVIAAAVEDIDAVKLLVTIRDLGYEALQAMNWGVGVGAYGFGRKQ